jgi:hypothetical protein
MLHGCDGDPKQPLIGCSSHETRDEETAVYTWLWNEVKGDDDALFF